MCSMSAAHNQSEKSFEGNNKTIQRSSAAYKPVVRKSHPVNIIQRVQKNPNSLTHNDVIQLQGTIGNKAVHKLLSELQGNRNPNTEGKPVQMKESVRDNVQSTGAEKTGMPYNLKTGLEALSGYDLSDLRTHRNSEKPQQVGALAYTQGTDIHIAPGQEKHLPHEGWHAVQQKQGRVKPTLQMKTGVHVNDDEGLEKEADLMGRKAAEGKKGAAPNVIKTGSQVTVLQRFPNIFGAIKKVPEIIKKAPEVIKKVPEIIKKAPEVIKKVPEIIKKAPEVIKKVPEIIKKAPEVIKKVPEIIKKVPEVIKKVPEIIKKAPEVIKSKLHEVIKKVPSAVSKPKEKGFWSKALDGAQLALDVAGLVPGVGEIADGANALIYLARGDKTNAALSAASMIPFAGWAGTGAKLVNKGIKGIKGIKKLPDIIKKVPDVIKKLPDMIKKAPDTLKKIPDIIKKVPDALKKLPDIIKKVPNVVKKLPDIIKKAPNALKKLPDIIKKAPNVIKKLPDIIKKAPNVVKKIPGIIKKVPDAIKKLPDIIKKAPNVIKKLPDMIKKVPDTLKKLPGIIKKAPNALKKLPDIIKKAPNVIKKLPDIIKKVPDTIKKLPEIIKKVPNTIKNLPEIIKKVPDKLKKLLPDKLKGTVKSGSTALTVYDPKFAAQQLLKDGKIPLENLKNMVPNGAVNGFKPSATITDGYKYNYTINGTKIEIKWHAPDANAAAKFPGSNSGSGWSAQIKVGNKLLGQDGKFYNNPSNITHISVEGIK